MGALIKPKMYDRQIIALSITTETIGIDSENVSKAYYYGYKLYFK